MTKKRHILFLFLTLSIASYSQVANQPSNMEVCDDDNDGFSQFDLTFLDAEVLGNQNPADFTITYHETQSDAIVGVNAIPTTYNNIVNDIQTIYIRLEDNNTSSFDTTMVDLIVNPSPVPVQPSPLELCDDNIADEIATFDLTLKDAEIIGPNANLSVAYFLTNADAYAQTNPLPSLYTSTSNPQTLYVSVTDVNTGCIGFTTLTIRVLPNPSPTPSELIPDIGLCDENNTGDGTEVFDLTENEALIINGEAGQSVTYYISESDAFSASNSVPNPAQFSNTSSPQTIYASVINDTTGCFTVVNFDIIVDPSPESVQPTPLVACGYLNFYGNEGYAHFDVESKNEEILNGLNPEIYIVSYYETQFDAENFTNQIDNGFPYRNSIAYNQTIYVNVINIETGCFNTVLLDLIIETCEISCDTEPITIETCYVSSQERYTFNGESNASLTIRFNSGLLVDGLFDNQVLTVYDSDGTTILGTITTNDNNGNLSGLIFSSSGNSISFTFSDSFFNCSENEIPLNFEVFCTETFGFINLNAFIDENADAIFDDNELLFTNGYFTYEKNNDGIINYIYTSIGNFKILSEEETDTYTINYYLNSFPEICYSQTTTSFYDISVAHGEVVTLNFPIINEQPCEDLAVYLVNTFTSPRPGFNYSNYIYYENLGLETISMGTINFTADNLLNLVGYNYFNSTDTIITNNNELTIEFTDLEPGETRYIGANLNCPTTVSLGEIVTNTVSYITDANDLYSANNYSVLSETVIGSYDPNDKMESHGKEIVYDDFVTSDEYLYYTIRFQNVGTAEAITVRIEDVLDTKLDETTFQMLRSSHNNVVTRIDNNLEWNFESINLPAEQDDAEGSNGFVYFKIKPNSGYAVGDIIENTASIYFDFNEPIITNTFQTEFVETLSVNDSELTSFKIFPNPAKGEVTIQLANSNFETGKVTIFDLQGKMILKDMKLQEQSLSIDISNLESGLYFVELIIGNASTVQKLMVN